MLFALNDMYNKNEFLIVALAFTCALIVSFTLHEFAHAYTAYKQGDPTPKIMGRVTVNPLAHIDPIGFLCSIMFFFGWAKPVQINPLNFKKYRRGMALTSCAGVIMNLIVAFVSCGIFQVVYKFGTITNDFVLFLYIFVQLLFTLNISLAVFNFLPIYPLDGFNFIASITKADNKIVDFLRRYGNIILIVVLLFLSDFLSIIIDWISTPILLFWEWVL